MKGVLRSFFMERRKELVLLLGAAVILVLRLCAAHFRWGLPHAADLPE